MWDAPSGARPWPWILAGAAIVVVGTVLGFALGAASANGNRPPAPRVAVSASPDIASSAAATPTPDATPAAARTPVTDPRPAARVPRGAQAATVSGIVDGDTLTVRAEAAGAVLASTSDITVRLLEVDTPETKMPGAPVQCFGPQATEFLRRMLRPGSMVWLTADEERRDRFGRHLLYAWTADGTFVNRAIVATGHGEAVLYPPNDAHIDELRAAEADARSAGRGLWGACRAGTSGTTAPDRDQPTLPPAAPTGPDCPVSRPIKGNANSGIYHVPGGRYYAETTPEECFATEEAARAAGFRPSRGG